MKPDILLADDNPREAFERVKDAARRSCDYRLELNALALAD